jgi:hypothetical protein
LAVVVACSAATAYGQARVELELATASTFPATAQQEWYRLLSELGVDGLRIRKAQSDDKVEVKVAGSERAPVYRVVGRLASGNQLELPGGKFSSNDRAGLSKWLVKLRSEGPKSSGTATAPFGLNAKQLAAVNADLTTPVSFSTKDMTPGEFVDRIAPVLKYPLNVDRAAKQRLGQAEPIGEQLEGLTSGSALAYALRSEGLGLIPKIGETKKLEYAVVSPGSIQTTTWPVGWPLEDRKPKDLIPELFEPRNAEIEEGYPLAEALEAICGRLKTPVLYDHYALARQGIDATKVKVKFPPSRTWYGKVLEKILFQARLKGEWRVDEAGKPLLWVTTLRPAQMDR